MKPVKKHELPVVPTANLVDIAILLIIFYMACSNFISQAPGKITLPQAPDLTKQKEPLILVSIDDRGNIMLQGQPMPNAAALESTISSLIQGKITTDARTVMFKCDAGVSREVYEPVIDAIAAAGGVILAVGEAPK